MTKHTDDTAARQSDKAASKPLTRLSADQIARRIDRQRPAIARTPAAGLTAQGRERIASGADGTGSANPTVSSAKAGPVSQAASEDASADAETRVDRSEELGRPAQNTATDPDIHALETTKVRQMVVWETSTDAEVISGWVAASTREDRHGAITDADPQAEDHPAAAAGDAIWRITAGTPAVDQQERRGRLRQLTTRDDPYLVQQVRSMVLDLVLEHPYYSDEADRRLLALDIRFAVWTLTKSVDGEFDPFRDLTEDRIAGFVRGTPGLAPGSRDSYAAALRRLAAGPTSRHRGARRPPAEPLSHRVEAGLWAAADGFAPTSWRHREGKTLLSLSFGAGALAEEINLMAPEDVLADTTRGELRVSVRLVRERTWVRDVPVLEPHYAAWLANRAAQVSGQTYLFKPDRVHRRNAINATTTSLAEANQAFARFRLNAARNTWAVRWLQAGVPFAAWANAAGVGPGTHLPTDLLAYLPTPAPTDVDDAFREAAAQPDRDRAAQPPGSAKRVPITTQPTRSVTPPAADKTPQKA